MRTSSNGRRFIEQFEGLSLKAYDDGTGVVTIGYGHTSAAGAPKVYKGQTITKEQADAILASDLGKVETQVSNLVHVPLNQNQFDALVSFHFNTGALGRSTALRKLNQGDYNGCASALLAYNRAGGSVLSGLTRRREAERRLFLTKPGVMPSGSPTVISVGLGATLAAFFKEHWVAILAGAFGLAVLVEAIIMKRKSNG